MLRSQVSVQLNLPNFLLSLSEMPISTLHIATAIDGVIIHCRRRPKLKSTNFIGFWFSRSKKNYLVSSWSIVILCLSKVTNCLCFLPSDKLHDIFWHLLTGEKLVLKVLGQHLERKSSIRENSIFNCL